MEQHQPGTALGAQPPPLPETIAAVRVRRCRVHVHVDGTGAEAIFQAEELALARRYREACGARSLRQLAQALGVSHETVRRHRTGKTPIPAIVLARLCGISGRSASWLLLGVEQS